MLEMRRLALLVGVADHGSIAAAAAAAGCTPSSASEQLVKLELDLGVELLERSPRSVRLTPAGEELVVHGRRILTRIELAERAAEEVAGLSGGRLRVASYRTGARAYVVPSIAAFVRRYPKVQVTFQELEPEFAIPAVQNGDIDVALVSRYIRLQAPDTTGLHSEEVQRDSMILAVPEYLASYAGPVSLQQFAKDPWVSMRPTEGFQAITELAAARLGFAPKIVARADSYRLVLDLVAAGLGVAIVPRRLARPRPAMRTYEIREPQGLEREDFLIRRNADRSRGVERMWGLIIDRFSRAHAAERLDRTVGHLSVASERVEIL